MSTLSKEEWLARMENECKELESEGFKVKTSEVCCRLVITIKANGFEPPSVGNVPDKRSTHEALIVVPRDYPFVFPATRWLTPIFHPNIIPPPPNGNGQISMEMLNIGNMRSLTELAERLVILIENPDPASPMPHPTCLEARRFFERHTDIISGTEGLRVIEPSSDTNERLGPRIISGILDSPEVVGWNSE
jgi:ubiquitin-protein ligase